MHRSFALAFGLVVLVACDDGSGGGGADGGSGGNGGLGGAGGSGGQADCAAHTDSAEPDFSTPIGRFALRVDPGYAEFKGSVFDGPPVSFHSEESRAGACRLLAYQATVCTPECAPSDYCIDGACVTTPSTVDAGTLEATGLEASPIEIAPSSDLYFWGSEAPSLGERVKLKSDGGTVGPFELSACVPPAVTPSSDWDQLMQTRAPGESVLLEWSDPLPHARIYLRMTTGIGTHGGISPIEIECEGPDLGSLELPGDYLDQLFADGWACGECGINDLKRYVADEAEIEGGVARLTVEARTSFYFHP